MFDWLKRKRDIQNAEPATDGIQNKWKTDDTWYKLDTAKESAEGLCEAIASAVLAKSNVSSFVQYEAAVITAKDGSQRTGCISKDFIPEGFKLIDSQRMLTRMNSPLATMLPHDMYHDSERNIEMFVKTLSTLPGMENFDKYMAQMFRFDAIIGNGDRTIFNIGILEGKENGKTVYRPAPFFDHGQSLMLWYDGWNDKNKPVEDIMRACTSRPFCSDPNAQAAYAEKLAGGEQFHTSFSKADLREILDKCQGVYPQEILDRAEKAMSFMIDKYINYFRGEEVEKRLDAIEQAMPHVGDYRAQRNENSIAFVNKEDPKERLIVMANGDARAEYDGKKLSWQDMVLTHTRLFSISHTLRENMAEHHVGRGLNIEM